MRERQVNYLKASTTNKYETVLNNAKEAAKFQEYQSALAANKLAEKERAAAAKELRRSRARY